MLTLFDDPTESAIASAMQRLYAAGAGPNEGMFALIRMRRAVRDSGGAVQLDVGRGVVASIPAPRSLHGWQIIPEYDR